jgi:high-affinity iron transporter
LLVGLLLTARLAGAAPTQVEAEQIVHLLEYVASDYGGAVSGGVVVNATELAEQVEVLAEASRLTKRLRPADGTQFDAQAEVARVARVVQAHAPAPEVSAAVKAVTSELTARYELILAPVTPPNSAHGRALFEQHCATCHGHEGRGDTPRALQYNPRPANFHDLAIAGPLSPRRVFSTARFGVPNTAMAPFDFLSDAERWDIAFYVSELDHAPPRGTTEATRMFALSDLASESDDELRDDLRAAGLDAGAVEESLSELRLHAPYRALREDEGDNTALVLRARVALRKVSASLLRGEREAAKLALLGVYLDDIEPIEAPLRAADPALTLAIETKFKETRAQIEADAPKAQIDAKLDELMRDLTKAGRALESSGGPPSFVTTMLTSAGIALREGTEAALLIAALLGVVTQAGATRRRWVHVGWVAAAVAGGLTWLVSQRLIAMSGLGREMLEGVSALLAAVVLFYVSYWLFAKREAARWITYLRSNAKSKQAALSLFGIAFLAVYREAFETVIFYQALVAQPGSGAPAAAGVLLGAVLLVGLVVAYGRAGKFAPPRSFFAFSSLLLYALSVVFAGQGLAALQTTGHVPLHPVRLPSVPLLGVYATMETYAVQFVLLGLALVAWIVARSQRAVPGTPRKDGVGSSREGAKL